MIMRRAVNRCQECQGNISVIGAPKWVDQPGQPQIEGRISAKPKAPGEACPKCGDYELRLESSVPHPTFGDMGVVNRNMKCEVCGFTEARMTDTKKL
jgi:hypothetical protein